MQSPMAKLGLAPAFFREAVFRLDTKTTVDHFSFQPQSEVPVFVGISMSLDMRNIEPITSCLTYAHNLSPVPVVIMVADRISKFNEYVFNKRSLTTGSADRYSLEKGLVFRELFEAISPRKDFKVIGWDDVHSPAYQLAVDFVENEFKENADFRGELLAIARVFFHSRKPNRPPKQTELEYLTKYIIWELPSLLQGIHYAGIDYRLLVHPMHFKGDIPSNPLKQLIKEILTTERFFNLKAGLITGSMAISDYYFEQD